MIQCWACVSAGPHHIVWTGEEIRKEAFERFWINLKSRTHRNHYSHPFTPRLSFYCSLVHNILVIKFLLSRRNVQDMNNVDLEMKVCKCFLFEFRRMVKASYWWRWTEATCKSPLFRNVHKPQRGYWREFFKTTLNANKSGAWTDQFFWNRKYFVSPRSNGRR